jgi:hypothetical protein
MLGHPNTPQHYLTILQAATHSNITTVPKRSISVQQQSLTMLQPFVDISITIITPHLQHAQAHRVLPHAHKAACAVDGVQHPVPALSTTLAATQL